jgi:opacity protein-like surface antigen
MKSLRAFFLGIIMVSFGAPLQASAEFIERDGGMYWSVRGGLSQVRSKTYWHFLGYDPVYVTVTDPNTGQTTEVLQTRGLNDWDEDRSMEMDYGFVTGASIGYTAVFPESSADLRFEAEAVYRRNDGGESESVRRSTTDRADSDSMDGTFHYNLQGHVEVRSIMLNGFVDFHTPSRFTPYLGLGAGYSQVIASDTFLGADDEIYALSWQAIAGLGYHLSPGTMVFVESRYFRLATDRWSEFFGTNELRNITFDDWSMGVRLTF